MEHLERWLKSYEPEKIFTQSRSEEAGSGFSILNKIFDDALPIDKERRLGFVKDAYDAYKPLKTPDWTKFGFEKGKEDISCMKAIGSYLAEVVKLNPTSFRMFSPDELASNKLDGVFESTTRNFQWDPETAHIGGRVTEILSEHTLQSWMQGYTLTGRHSVFPSYEAFMGIVASKSRSSSFIISALTDRMVSHDGSVQ